MSDVRLSSSTKALLRAAKADGPSAAARAKVWAGVSSAVGGVAGAAGAAGASGTSLGAAAGMGTAKLLTVGALLGGTVTVGIAVALLRIVPASTEPPPAATVRATAAVMAPGHGVNPPAPISTPDIPIPPSPLAKAATAVASPPDGSPGAAKRRQAPLISAASPDSPNTHPPVAAHVSSPAPPEDPLAREASLVSAARAALGRGDPAAALRAIRAARGLRSHQLVPEELAVEGQALRALGRAEEAKTIDETLRSEYPESALAR